MIEQAKAVAQRLRNAEVVLFSKDADTIDALVQEVERLTPLQYRQAPCHKFCESTAFNIEIKNLRAEAEQYLSDWKACTAMNRKLLAEVERLKQEQAEPEGCWKCGEDGGTSCGAAHCGLLEPEPEVDVGTLRLAVMGRILNTVIVDGESPEVFRDAICNRVMDVFKQTCTYTAPQGQTALLQQEQAEPVLPCSTCDHCQQGTGGLHSFDADVCRECKHYWDDKHKIKQHLGEAE
jgi:hypothetical protein